MVVKRKAKKTNTNKQYSSLLPEIIESSGNFLNNVKHPIFVTIIASMVFLGYVMHRYYGVAVKMLLDTDKKIHVEEQQNVLLKHQNEALDTQNILLGQQNKLLDELNKKGFTVKKSFNDKNY